MSNSFVFVALLSDITVYGCNSITSITISENIDDIGYGAFDGCYKIKKFNVPKSNKFYKAIDGNLYDTDAGCLIKYAPMNKATSFTVPNGVTEIGERAFFSNYSLKEVKLPEGLKVINKEAFSGCDELEKINIPDTVYVISTGAFIGNKLKEIKLPNKISLMIGDEAFQGCENLIHIKIPDNVNYLGEAAFDGCTNLKNVTFGKGIKKLNDMLFWNCNSLEDVDIPDSVTEIGNKVFNACTSLKEISIPDSVKKISTNAFDGCENLEKLYINDRLLINTNRLPERCKVLNFYHKTMSDIVHRKDYDFSDSGLKYHTDDGETYAVIDYKGKNKNVVIPSTYEGKQVTRIGFNAFGDRWTCININSLELPDCLTSIGAYAFNACSYLSSITIPDSVTYLNKKAFIGCPLDEISVANRKIIENIELPDGCKVIDRSQQREKKEISKPSEAAAKAADETITKVDMSAPDRGIESLNRISDREVVNRGFRLKNAETFKALYDGESLYHNEGRDEEALISKLCCLTKDKDQVIRVFKSSGQFRDFKPTSYYERIVDEQMTNADKLRKETLNKRIKIARAVKKNDLSSGKI